MNIFRPKSRLHSFFSRVMVTSALVWLVGAVHSPEAAAATVLVDQAPLIVQAALPPNIVLMLDDSGSMDSDYMPDWGYIDHSSNMVLRYPGNNGTYYNPGVTYSPPPTADGGSYPNSPGIGNAFADGFKDQSTNHEVDVTQYSGSYDYYEQFTATVPSYYDATLGCHSGDTLVTSGTNAGKCATAGGTTYTYYDATWKKYGRNWYPICNSGDSYNTGRGQCEHAVTAYTYYTPDTPTCPQGGTYDSTTQQCKTTGTKTAYLFAYTTNDGSGYVQHYVGKSQDDCSVAPSGSDCDYSAATQQNVANWFSYYRTRMLMAKSGLMTAFSGLNTDFRVGYGDIDGSARSLLGSDYYAFTTQAGYSTYSTGIAQVKPFCVGTDCTAKENFWTWIASTNPTGSTPLRAALENVGKYYKTDTPWKTMATDPDYGDNTNTMLACRQSYTILTTDGFWNGTAPGNGNIDNTDGTVYTDPHGTKYGYKAAAPFSDSYSDTLADVAMKYWKTDLRTDISNEVPTNDEDKAFWQHMVSFTIGLGFTPVNDQGTTRTSDDVALDIDQITAWANGDSTQAISNFAWPKPASNDLNNIADLAHAAINGHGGFYSATSPEAFAEGLRSALNRASQRVGTGASLAANSTELNTGTFAYQANYYTATWKGDLKALEIYTADNPSLGQVKGQISSNAKWNAATMMPAAADRTIYTYNPDAATYVKFSDPSVLSTTEQNALGSSATEQQNIINYLRGDASLEKTTTGGKYRSRIADSKHFVLGDIVDSQPVYVGASNPNQFQNTNFTGSSTYAKFASDKASRTALIYVASNDGMLHGFDATTGAEDYAYLPAGVITDSTGTTGTTSTSSGKFYGISDLANPDYGTDSAPHQYFNDGELTVADAYFKTDSAWHTVLVGTTGRGLARTIYALDVTDPTDVKFLWERSANDGNADGNSKYIGQMIGKPVVAQVADGQWAVLMGNGMNSASGTAALLQFDLGTGALNVHATDATGQNGLAAPAVWINDATNAVSSVAYAGDLQGRVWSFQISKTVTDPVSGTTSIAATPDSTGTKLFTTSDGSNAQPITAGMLVGRDPLTGNRWLFFGTGRYLASSDLADKQVQTWYALIVDSPKYPDLVTNLSKGLSSLKQRSIILETSASAGDATATPPVPPTLAARVVTQATTNEANIGATDATSADPAQSGWYLNLEQPYTNTNGAIAGYNAQGERMVTPNQFQGSLLVGTTRIPTATDPCNPSGSGWIMAIEPFTGTNPDPAFFDLNGDGAINGSDKVTLPDGTTANAAGVGFVSIPNNPIFVGNNMLNSYDNGDVGSIYTSGAGGNLQRVSWRELINE
ncbi:pilus assembly protein [Dyella lutea]|uniref:PilC/PilY family type IV pilus protein n=1 Tax=Dyella lutea TaxID=2950441 RepID=A0ABT1FDN2_9GAMM|nr:PilC/PilY family type IV pilus protein [Dyella lutea]MCP1375496.1 PilC/PilY family type IV pilus protein [Dyella lutea]